jgi:tRNA threonylcarbamoyladenosine biosynthesis protein TsaE
MQEAPAVVRLALADSDATRALGERLGRAAAPGDRILLEGPFGAGKTTLVQGLARGLGIESEITSPSFVLETQHRGRLRLHHVDLYRLERIEPAFLDELEESLFGDGVAAVEWPEQLPADLRDGATLVRLALVNDGAHRAAEVSGGPARLRAAALGGDV